MPKSTSEGAKKTPLVVTGHETTGDVHTLTYSGGVVIVARHPWYDVGKLRCEISAYLDSVKINTATINLLHEHQRVDFQQVAIRHDGRVDWQDCLLSAIEPLRTVLESSPDGTETTTPLMRTPTLITMADVTPEPVEWLWEPYIPLGKETILEGDPGQGKTWLAMAIAASLTRGRTPWSGEACPAVDIL